MAFRRISKRVSSDIAVSTGTSVASNDVGGRVAGEVLAESAVIETRWSSAESDTRRVAKVALPSDRDSPVQNPANEREVEEAEVVAPAPTIAHLPLTDAERNLIAFLVDQALKPWTSET